MAAFLSTMNLDCISMGDMFMLHQQRCPAIYLGPMLSKPGYVRLCLMDPDMFYLDIVRNWHAHHFAAQIVSYKGKAPLTIYLSILYDYVQDTGHPYG